LRAKVRASNCDAEAIGALVLIENAADRAERKLGKLPPKRVPSLAEHLASRHGTGSASK
jgi:hypothetical protein